MKTTKYLTITAMGIALYVAISMAVKIPFLVGHLALDLGYIVLAFYAMAMGPISAAIVGCAGSFIVSLLASGWIAIGWPLGNLLIGLICGFVYRKQKNFLVNAIITVIAVFIGVAGIKTVVECALYSIPLGVKFAKNLVAFIADAITMVTGLCICQIIYLRVEPYLK